MVPIRLSITLDLVSNLITIAQQQLIYRGLEKKGCILVRNSHEQAKRKARNVPFFILLRYPTLGYPKL